MPMRSLREAALLVLLRLRPSEWQKTLVFAAVIGVLGALATIGFRQGVLLAEQLMFGRSDSLVRIAQGLAWWQRLAVPALGGVIAGLLLMWSRRVGSARAGGDYMEAISLGSGELPVRVSLARALSSAATVATGGAIGREGPMVQLAALTGSLLGRWRNSPIPRRRLMVACGAAAGVATAYSAPIAGALFVAEIVLQSVAIESLGPLLVAAVTANLTLTALLGFSPVYHMPSFVLPHGSATLLLAGLGIVGGLAAPGYLWLLDRAHGFFNRWTAPSWLKLGAGGLALGAISMASPAVWGNGYSVVDSILQGGWAWDALLAILALKLLAVAATTGSGAVGGIFTPTLFMGAVAGALFGAAMEWLFPGVLPIPASVAVGMGAFLAACTHAPLMSVLMIFEMTENYGVVVPLMLACVVGHFISQALRAESIYSAARATLPDPKLAIAADFVRTGSATVQVGQPLREIEEVFLRHRWQHVYVLDEAGRFAGAISLYDLAPLLRDAEAHPGWPAQLVRVDFPRVRDVTPSWQVLESFAAHSGERLPVLDAAGRLLGHVTKTDLVLMFRERLGN
jgi:chloride channel protein, CIC family